MTTYATREVVVRRVEFAAEAGSDIATVNKVQQFAWLDYCQRTGTSRDADRYDNWCTVHPRDEEIVFAFEVEHKPTDAERAVSRTREALKALCERWAARSGRLDAEDFELISDALAGAGLP